jgi:glucose/arabinose dehydrogenase
MGPADNFVSTESAQTYFRIETVASDLDVPWAFAWLPNGNMLFTERKGRVRIIENRTLRREPVFTVPDVEPSGESGLMDITLHPDFAGNSFVYLAYAYNNEGKKVKVVRYKYSNSTFEDATVVIQDIPGAPNHAGMRADFGPDGKLYITTGDATEGELAQKMDSLAGKTLRLNDDGSVPLDNPFVKRTGVRPEIWTLGHRNSQGIAWQPGSNLMFQTEHGPSGGDGPGGGDEVNIVEKGKNYGWPTIHHTESKPGLVAPLLEYTPACAPGSAMFYTGEIFAELKGSLLFGCLRGARITRVKLDGRKVVGQESFMVNKVGRIREMAQGPDGYIYFSTSNRDGRGSPIPSDDRIMRLVPVA